MNQPTRWPAGLSLLLLAVAAGLPAALIGFILGTAADVLELGLAFTALIAGAYGVAVARERDARVPVVVAAALVASLSGCLWFFWGVSNLYG